MAHGGTGQAATAVVRKPRPIRKEAPIAFRPRPGTRARLEKRAGQRSISTVVELAVDAYLGRVVRDVDPSLRAALAEELSVIGDRLAEIEHQERGVGRNLNQTAKFLNTYRELPLDMVQELRLSNEIHAAVLAALVAIRDRLDQLIDGSAAA